MLVLRNLKSNQSYRWLGATATKTWRCISTTTLKDSYEHVLVEKRDKVGVVTLNRPKALNALCDALFDDLLHASKALDQDDTIGCLVLTGSKKGRLWYFKSFAPCAREINPNFVICLFQTFDVR